LNAQLTLRRALLTTALSVLLLIPACGGSDTPTGSWFKVKTIIDRQILVGFVWEWETIQEPMRFQGWWVRDNINPGGLTKGVGPIATGLNGVYTVNNARVPAFWTFKSWDGPCNGKLFPFDLPNGTTTVEPAINSGDMVILWCKRENFSDDSAILGTNTIDENNNVVAVGCCNTDTLYADNSTTLHPGDYIHSQDGRFILTLGYTGAAAIYKVDDGTLLWMTAEAGSGASLVMQNDGNLVLYNSGHGAVWYSGTFGNPNSYLIMQNDGNLVVYAASGTALWSSMFGLVGGGGGGGGGRWKDDGNGGCYWDPNDSGPNQCVPQGSH
jgi:hypothetical protein